MIVVLCQPQIPENTGNIVRTCAVTGSELVLVKPLGFSTAHRRLKRAGLDYWQGVKVTIVDDFDAWLQERSSLALPFFLSSKAKALYTSGLFTHESILVFGSETAGLPQPFYKQWQERLFRIPMLPEQRCLNLATSVGIVVYEAWRQQQFAAIEST